jgi:hypothetical protein
VFPHPSPPPLGEGAKPKFHSSLAPFAETTSQTTKHDIAVQVASYPTGGLVCPEILVEGLAPTRNLYRAVLPCAGEFLAGLATE